MSKGKRDSYTSQYKLKVALEALKGDKTLAQLASEFRVHPSQDTKWKEQLNGSASAVFGSPSKRKDQERVTEAELMEKVGRLSVEVDWLKKILGTGNSARRTDLLIGGKSEPGLSFKRKCDLLDVSRSTAYSRQKPAATRRQEEDVELVREIEEVYERCPFYGSRRIAAEMVRNGRRVSQKRVQSLMRKMGIMGIAPGPETSKPHPQNKKYPCLLKNVEATRSNQIWSTDITYIPTKFGFMYLTAIVDWYSRRILSCRLSNTMSVTPKADTSDTDAPSPAAV